MKQRMFGQSHAGVEVCRLIFLATVASLNLTDQCPLSTSVVAGLFWPCGKAHGEMPCEVYVISGNAGNPLFQLCVGTKEGGILSLPSLAGCTSLILGSCRSCYILRTL